MSAHLNTRALIVRFYTARIVSTVLVSSDSTSDTGAAIHRLPQSILPGFDTGLTIVSLDSDQ